MTANSRSSEPDFDPVILVGMIGALVALVALVVLLFALVEWPVFVWSLVHLRPMLLDPASAIGGSLNALFSSHPLHAHPDAWRGVRELPPLASAIVLDLTGAAMLFVAALAGGVRLERWKGRSRFGLRPWDPRAKLRRRAWARPRDLLHLQRPGLSVLRVAGLMPYARGVKNRLMRFLAAEQRMPDAPGGDTWPAGVMHETWLWSARELHAMVVAPTGSGKTRLVLTTALMAHEGAAVVLSNLRATSRRRRKSRREPAPRPRRRQPGARRERRARARRARR